MTEFDEPEMVWVRAHRDELIGLDVEAACAMVRSAGFRPIVFVPRPGVALAMAYWVSSVTMICNDGIVGRVEAG